MADNRFSPKVKEVISYSREEAMRMGNDYIGTEHLLLALLNDKSNHNWWIVTTINVTEIQTIYYGRQPFFT